MTTDYEPDGLDSFSLDQIGRKTGAFGGAKILKFNKGDFFTREGEVMSAADEFLSLGLKKFIQKFIDKKLLDTIPVPDGEKANVTELNEKAPRAEWGPDLSGKIVGPYKLVLVLKLMNIVTLDLFAFVTDSVGGGIAIGALSDKAKIVRRMNGPNVSPVITLGSGTFKSKDFGLVKCPELRIVRWVALNGAAGALSKPAAAPAIEKPATTDVPATTNAPTTVPTTPTNAPPTAPMVSGLPLRTVPPINLSTVEEPTLKQEKDSDVPF